MFRTQVFAGTPHLVLIAMTYLACAQPVLHKTATATFPAREPSCVFDVVGSHPGPGYVEVAQISIEGNRSNGAGQYDNPQEFANVVHAKICAVGGDVLATEVNGVGVIVRGIVFHRVDEPQPPPQGRPAEPVPAADTCNPICSPGFSCNAGTCVPQCNPACTEAETCGNDRLCHPRT
jgi:hypothetical protein